MSFSPIERDSELFRSIVEASGYLNRYVDGLSQVEFLSDAKTQDAVSMRLQQILECSIKLSPESKAKLKISWSSLIAMRIKISHSYIEVDSEVVWEVIRNFDEFKKLIGWAKENI